MDIQNDFCPGGALPVKGGDRIIPPLNKVITEFSRSNLPVFFTRDWHPPDHTSFKARGGPWPPHCVQGTWGAELRPDLNIPPESEVVSKGQKPGFEAYSGFQGTNLEERLKELVVDEVFVCGLATDYCVKQTTLDALKSGFKVDVLEDCTMGVNLKPDDSRRALNEVSSKGARLLDSARVAELLTSEA